MKVKLKTSRVLWNGVAQQTGEVIDVSNDEGKRLIEFGQAEAAAEPKNKPAKDES